MAYVGKTYKHEKDENFEAFVDSLGLPADRAESVKKAKTSQKLVKEGNSYSLVTTISGGDELVVKFQDGVEFEETVALGNVAKTTINLNGNTLNQVQKFPDGRSLTIKREYSEDKLVVTINSSTFDGTARRYYTAV